MESLGAGLKRRLNVSGSLLVQQLATISTISAPMASDAVAAGLGALSTWSALGRAIRWKSCTSSPSGAMACARTPLPPVSRSSGLISGTRRCRDRQNSSRLKERRNSYQHLVRIAPHETPESAVCQGVKQIARIEIGLAIALAGEGQHRVGTGLDAGVNHAREVYAQEGKARVGDRVDQVAHQVAARLANDSTRRGIGGCACRGARPRFGQRDRNASPRS